MVDMLLGKLVDLFYTRRVDSAKWERRLTPDMEKKLNNEISKAFSFHVIAIVAVKDGRLLDCHAATTISVIHCLDRSPYEYCSRYFTVDKYRLTYAESILPVPNVEKPLSGEVNEIATIISPPPIKRAPGWPKMKQAAAPEETNRNVSVIACFLSFEELHVQLGVV
ncbi:uncharacterized protein LOC141680550 [Apium graveolens]|uniref:uncharacterized protein LOC141680550 n=1 Tax=Apium graveolens TaxID=4045 RepID=UPI003D78E7F6